MITGKLGSIESCQRVIVGSQARKSITATPFYQGVTGFVPMNLFIHTIGYTFNIPNCMYESERINRDNAENYMT